MTDALNLQAAEGETPDETKASRISLKLCRTSYVSVSVCMVK